jgi:hypothetical protein
MKKTKMKLVIKKQRDVIASQNEIIKAHHEDFLKIKDLSNTAEKAGATLDVYGLGTLFESVFKVVDK